MVRIDSMFGYMAFVVVCDDRRDSSMLVWPTILMDVRLV
jgi:hypothetical protein